MKSRLALTFATLAAVSGAATWAAWPAATPVPMASVRRYDVRVEPSAGEPLMVPLTNAAVALPPAEVVAPQEKSSPMVHVNTSGDVQYVARDGDTASQLAVALLGSDSKDHRDAVIAANVSLRSNPDLVLTGQTYSIDPSTAQAADAANSKQSQSAAVKAPAVEGAPVAKPTSDGPNEDKDAAPKAPKLKYIAQPGDTVRGLAAHFLGGDTKVNRDAIIAENTSLQRDADLLIAGQTYTIVVPNGLVANPDAPEAKNPATETEADADDVTRVSVGRSLRYTAKPGDTVSEMAIAILGSDTPANRDLIINSNVSLKQNPDHLVAGQTYWIAAPTDDKQ